MWLAVEYGVYRVDLGDTAAGKAPGDPAPDAPITPSAFAVEVGVGATFEPLPVVLGLEHGSHGLQHMTLSIRAAVSPSFHAVRLTLVGALGSRARSYSPGRADVANNSRNGKRSPDGTSTPRGSGPVPRSQ